MKKPIFKFAAVVNAILLVVGFIGCQSGAFTWLADKGEPSEPAPKAALTAPSQESPPANPPSLPGLVTGLAPAGTGQNGQASEAGKSAPTFMPSTKSIILPNFAAPETKKDASTPSAIGSPP